MTEQVTPESEVLPDANASQEVQTTDVVTEPTGSEADPSPAATDPGDTAKPKKSGEDRRIDELTRRWREEQRRSDRLMRMLEERATEAPKPTPSAPAKPKDFSDFNYDENAYREHLFQEARTQAAESVRTEAAQWRKEQETQGRRQLLDTRVEKFAKATEDYHEVVTDSTPVSEAMGEAIMDTEEGPAILYYLGKNPDVAMQLYKLSPVQAGREIARIEDRIVAERKKAAEKPVSKAPAPAPTLGGADPGNVSRDPSQMSDAEFSKWFRKKRGLA
jgi:hypothetical protein